jgi:chitinase
MSLTEIEELIKSKGLTPTLLEAQMMKSIQWADQWIGYDDDETFAMKKSWASDYCFGGTMAWSVDYYSGVGSGDNVPLSTDGTCGFDAQMRCGNDFGACCSSSGWCGDDDGHCGSGCQSTYGNCTVRTLAPFFSEG